MNIAGLHWFDWLVVVVALTGMLVGWQRGWSGEWPKLVMWLLILGLGRLLAPLMAEFAGTHGLTRMGGGLCGYSWTMAIFAWLFSGRSREDSETGEPEAGPRRKSGLSGPLGGALAGVARYAAVLLVTTTMLAMLPGTLTQFAEFRSSVLFRSAYGNSTQIYWERLSYEREGVPPFPEPAPPVTDPTD